MKKMLLFVLSLALCFALAGCGGNDKPADSNTGKPDPKPTVSSTVSSEEKTPSEGGESSGAVENESSEGGSAAQTVSGYTIEVNGKTLGVDMDVTDIKGMLGDEDNYFESPSCAFQGMDKVYTYGSVVIKTYPDGDKDFVLGIELKDDLAETAEGICIGSTKDEVVAAYGTPAEETDSAVVYTKDGCKLAFILEGDEVSAITYTSPKSTQ